MDEAVLGETDENVHEAREDGRRVAQLLDVVQLVSGCKAHHEAVPIHVDGLRHGEAVRMKCLRAAARRRGSTMHGGEEQGS